MRKTAGPLFKAARRNENKKFAGQTGAEARQAELPGKLSKRVNSDDQDKSDEPGKPNGREKPSERVNSDGQDKSGG